MKTGITMMALIMTMSYCYADVLIYKNDVSEKCEFVRETACCYVVKCGESERSIRKAEVENIYENQRGRVLHLKSIKERKSALSSRMILIGAAIPVAFGSIILLLADRSR